MNLKLLLKLFIPLSMILLVSTPVFASEIDDLKKSIEAREKEIEELRKQADQYENAINEKQEEADSLKGAIVNFNGQINNVEYNILLKQREISSVKLQIRRTELEIETKNQEILRTNQQIAALLREIYENDDKEALELALENDNLSDFFSQVEYRNILQEDLKIKLEKTIELKGKLEQSRQEEEAKHNELNALKEDLENRNQVLFYQKNQKQNLLDETKNQEWKFKQLLSDTEAKAREINKEIFELEERLRQTLNPDDIPLADSTFFSWPTEGLITQRYGCIENDFAKRAYPSCNEGRGGFHNGVDIASGAGTPVKAAAEGEVVAIENSPYAYGKWIAIKHKNGLISIYTHLSVQSVSLAQAVARESIVGYMGSTGFSTGSHLHFTVYAPNTFSTKPSKIAGILPIGATLDPFDYLP